MKKILLTLFLSLSVSSVFAGANHLSLFLGATIHEDESPFTAGFDYVYNTPLLDSKLGVGFLGDFHKYHGYNIEIYALVLSYKLPQNFRVIAAPGIEKKGSKTYDLFRLGFAKDFTVGGHYSISPLVSVDFVNNKTLVVPGVAFGIGF